MIFNDVKLFLHDKEAFQDAKTLMVAVSGGVDSIVLCDIVAKIVAQDPQKRLIVAHFNHQLRSTSDRDEQLVIRMAKKYGAIYVVKKWETPAERNVEAAARNARYQFFASVIAQEKVDILLTGHHLNDLAETMIMRITRGTSLRGLRGIQSDYRRLLTTQDHQPVQVQIMRPLMHHRKQELYDYANLHQLPYFEDETNHDPKYFRNRMRHQILPLFEAENPHFLESILAMQEQIQASYKLHYAAYLQDEPHLLMHSLTLNWVLYVPAFCQLTPEKRKVYLSIFFEERLIEDVDSYTREAIDRMEQIMMNDRLPNSRFQLNEKWEVRREYDYVYIQPIADKKANHLSKRVHINQLNHWQPISSYEQVGLFDERYFSTSQLQDFPYVVCLFIKPQELRGFYMRHRKQGDRLELNDEHGDIFHKKVSRFMIDHKIPMDEREAIWLFCDKNDYIVSIVGHLATRKYRMRHPQAQAYFFVYRRYDGMQ